LRAICITRGLPDTVASEQIHELRDDVIWIEWRGTLSRCIDNDGVALPMTDSAGHRIGRPTRRIGKTEIPHASNRRPLDHTFVNATLDLFARNVILEIRSKLRQPFSAGTRVIALASFLNY